ncbi:hypothetical protein DHD80_08955 [Gramella sp. AN32]|nr:hypothetical protein [Gramella sp. AN32]
MECFAQAPEKFSFQAIIRNGDQQLVSNSMVDLKILIKKGSKSGSTVYEEHHYKKTNDNGLVSLEIGTGEIAKGTFKDIPWNKGLYYIETYVDPNGEADFKVAGVSQLTSVPYALYSKSTENFTGEIMESQISDLTHFNSADILGTEMAFENWDKDASDDFDGQYSSLSGIPEIYNKEEINDLLRKGNRDNNNSNYQKLDLNGARISISSGNSINLTGWDTNANDDFSGDYNDLLNKPDIYDRYEIDEKLNGISAGEGITQSLNLEGDQLLISGGNSVLFENWDTNALDDFSGKFSDLLEIPQLYTAAQVDSIVVNLNGSEGTVQSLNLNANQLSITGANTISFENWDIDSSDDFSGDYLDLINTPQVYNKDEIDELLINIDGGIGIAPTLLLEETQLSITGGNTISFENWDTNAADDFSGSFADLIEVPELYTASQIDSLLINVEGGEGMVQSLSLEENLLSITGGNSISFENWDTNAADDFSGSFADLIEVPELYTASQIDSLLINVEGGEGMVQSLSLEENLLSITGGNSISFENWDTNAADDFSGSFADLIEVPELYTASQIDSLLISVEGGEGIVQSLSLEENLLSITGGNSISFENWDTNATDDFSGRFADLIEVPELYTASQIDSLFVSYEGGEAVVQSLSLLDNTLSITGGNSISFENWDTNAADDFSGSYSDLMDKPILFSGSYKDLTDIPQLYTTTEIDNLIAGIETGNGSPQDLILEGDALSITGGNSISFTGWDTNASDDFSGSYSDLMDKPILFSGSYKDLTNIPQLYTTTEIDNLIAGIEIGNGTPQELVLEGSSLSISGGNAVNFEGWDTNGADDFDGNYSSLTGAPQVYTQSEVDSIKAEILKQVEENYAKKALVVPFSSSRNIKTNDVGNTIACTLSATLTIDSNFIAMAVGDVINIEVHGTTFTVKGASGVVINGNSGGNTSIGNNDAYTGGIIRKTGNNSYIVL